MRKAGILLAVSSLPSNTGIGDFGYEGYKLVDYLVESGMKYWQILPLNPLGYGNSPYQPYSSYAMDEIYCSLDLLKEEKLITKFKKLNATSQQVDYEAVRAHKEVYLHEAFKNFKPNKAYEKFISNEWVKKYAIFLTLKKKNQMKCWLEWPLEDKECTIDLTPLNEKIEYEMFIQFKLYEQWTNLKKYANSKGIKIIGDIPIYVGIDSEDVWSHRESFLLDDDGRPTFIAGVPPDYFSVTGQRWGNPIYDWDYLKENDFKFWINRLAYTSKMFDLIRIDHFRAFDTYWKIPESCPTAVEGEWIEAPGYEFFDTVYKKMPKIKIIAEDLGDLREEVLILRDHYELPGMKIIEFEFNPTSNMRENKNQVVYPGTHDNQTIRSWYASQSSSFKRATKKYFSKSKYENITDQFLELTMKDVADTAILPMQDILNLTDKGRMNTPGTIGSPNWQWKMKDFVEFEKRIPFLKELVKKSKR